MFKNAPPGRRRGKNKKQHFNFEQILIIGWARIQSACGRYV
jgi:hypothetical protein